MAQEAIFIGYRRGDTGDAAAVIYDELAAKFGRARVFKDTDSLRPGVNYVERIRDVLSRCRFFLALIGPAWLESKDDAGRKRIDDPEDLVRVEIEVALSTAGVEVVPVLVDGARIPQLNDLPESLQPLLLNHAAKVRRESITHDVRRLSQALKEESRAKTFGLWRKVLSHPEKNQTVWVVRHARAISLDPNAGYRADVARPLSDEGQAQARALRSLLISRGVSFAAVGASPAERAMRTAAIVANCPLSQVNPIAALIPPDSGTGREAYRINYLFDHIGYAPLDGYRKLPGDARVMDGYGRRCWRSVRRFLEASNGGDVLIVGHAVQLQSAFLAAVKGNTANHKAMRELLLQHVFPDAGCLRARFEGYGLQSVEPVS